MLRWGSLMANRELRDPTWKDLAKAHPGFVQWVVQRFGPLPEGPIVQADYERYVAEYEKEKV